MQVIRKSPEENDPEALAKFIETLIKIAKRLKAEEVVKSQDKT